ncbi:MAG: hypothetical protein ACRDRH_26990 [Pseudonocardia sp.]
MGAEATTATLTCADCGREGQVTLRDDAGHPLTLTEYLAALDSANMELLCGRCVPANLDQLLAAAHAHRRLSQAGSKARCRCGLPTQAPSGVTCWQPEFDADPGPHAAAVIRVGDTPARRRAVWVSGGWDEAGNGGWDAFHRDPTTAMPWRCAAGTSHPVVAVDRAVLDALDTPQPGQLR